VVIEDAVEVEIFQLKMRTNAQKIIMGNIDIGCFSFAGKAEEHDLEAIHCAGSISAFYVKG
jgi:hypothetical protein